MEFQKAYRLDGERLDEFIILLGENGFFYEGGLGQIRFEEKDVTAGRILDTSPRYLIVNPPHPKSKVQRDVVSQLVELAKSF